MKNTNNENLKNIESLIIKDSKLNLEKLLKKYDTSLEGISIINEEEKIEKYGKNIIDIKENNTIWHKLKEAFINPFNIVLIIVAIITFITDVVIATQKDYATFILIISTVIISAIISFNEQTKSDNAAKKLKKMISNKMDVIRDGNQVTIDIENVVPGDIVKLSSGDMIPGDVRFIETKDLFIDQASLTGESNPVEKFSELKKFDTITDISNIGFMGTNIVSGSSKAVVLTTGNNTYFGSMAKSLYSVAEKNTFEKGIDDITKILIKFMFILVPIVLIVNCFSVGDIWSSLIFAITIAVGLTPEMLPVITTSTLAKGAVEMSKKKTIVKRLSSIQTFGQMNILCTDKTGTLTEDKIVLEKYLDVMGNEDFRVLKHAFLNAYFQTGLKSNIDEAVIKRGIEHGLDEISTKYVKVDEIPFDFSRRRLSIIVNDGTKTQLITKGAVEEILNICTLVDYKGKVEPITNSIKENIKKITKELNKQGLRVVAVCQKNDLNKTEEFNVSDEKNMVLIGFIGFLDPPKETAKSSIEKLGKNGIRVIVLTGDNVEVTRCVCDKVGIKSNRIVTGAQIDKLADQGLKRLLKKTNIFAKLSPIQKARIVRLLRDNGNVVGYMGDGINDSPSLVNSDVGISVDTAVDIAKESADIILLEKDLHVLLDGVKEGRHTYANLMKYIKLAASFNFGEVMSVIIASILLPFLPETPIQLLVEGLLYDFGQLTLPLDNVDEEYLRRPKQFDVKGLQHFMLFMGPLSSCFDLIVFALIWFVFKAHEVAVFQTTWFTYSIVSNLVGMHIIRTAKIPFKQSHASKAVYISSIALSIIAMIVPFTFIGKAIGLTALAPKYFSIILGVPILYCIVAGWAKKIYIKKYGEWI